jgi:hypothetical protein
MWMDAEMVTDDPKRIGRLAMLLAWRTLRRSVTRGRPMSLPNLLRLHTRIAWDQAQSSARPAMRRRTEDALFLRAGYLAAQPFDSGALPSLDAVLPPLPPRATRRTPRQA